MTAIAAQYTSGNRLLDMLSVAERTDVTSTMEVIDVKASMVTHAPDAPYDWVVFPIDAVLSVVTMLDNGEMAEVGTIGNEGASGVEIAFGAPVLRTTICQVEGRVARLSTTEFLDAVNRLRGFDALIRSTEKARMYFMEQMIVCNAVHELEQRLARWLLMVADRASREEYELTHVFLSVMLGVRRATVSEAAKRLSDAKAIHYSHGRVQILNRPKLESLTCECYMATVKVFDDALNTWGRRPKELTGRSRP